MSFLETAQNFIKNWDLERTKILRPARLVFLCGGLLGDRDAPPVSARDALMRQLNDGALGGAKVILAEKANAALPDSSFKNLLDLEECIGAIVDAVVLFVESPGSICELGAFCKIPDIANRLTTFVMNEHAIRSSFVRNGPLKYLAKADGIDNFSTFDWDVGVGGVRVEPFVLNEIKAEAEAAASARPIKEGFLPNSLGHKVYVVLAISFILRGGKIGEIKDCARIIWPYISETEIRNFLDVLQVVDLLKPVTNGKNTYYVPRIDRINLDISLSDGGSIRDPVRYLTDVVSQIKEEDKNRLVVFGVHNADS